jgi:hypothetical protein
LFFRGSCCIRACRSSSTTYHRHRSNGLWRLSSRGSVSGFGGIVIVRSRRVIMKMRVRVISFIVTFFMTLLVIVVVVIMSMTVISSLMVLLVVVIVIVIIIIVFIVTLAFWFFYWHKEETLS